MKLFYYAPLIALFLFAQISVAQSVGETAPDFSHSTLDHGTVELNDYQGKVIFLFFVGYS